MTTQIMRPTIEKKLGLIQSVFMVYVELHLDIITNIVKNSLDIINMLVIGPCYVA